MGYRAENELKPQAVAGGPARYSSPIENASSTSCVSPDELRREDEATCALSSAKVRFAQDSGFELVWGFSCQVVVLGFAESSLFGGVSR